MGKNMGLIFDEGLITIFKKKKDKAKQNNRCLSQ
jgi:hypothetical protein